MLRLYILNFIDIANKTNTTPEKTSKIKYLILIFCLQYLHFPPKIYNLKLESYLRNLIYDYSLDNKSCSCVISCPIGILLTANVKKLPNTVPIQKSNIYNIMSILTPKT